MFIEHMKYTLMFVGIFMCLLMPLELHLLKVNVWGWGFFATWFGIMWAGHEIRYLVLLVRVTEKVNK